MTKPNGLPGKPIRANVADADRFRKLSATLFGEATLSEDGVRAATVVIAAMRKLQTELGPGHVPFELVASTVPEAYKKNWAKRSLGLVERR